MLSFKHFLIESSSLKFWFDTKTKKWVDVETGTHQWEVSEHPEKFGLTKKDIQGGYLSLLATGWVRFTVSNYSGYVTSGNEFSIEAKDLKDAAKAAQSAVKKFGDPELIFLDLTIGSPKSASLNPSQIAAFIKTGKIVPRSSVAAFR